MSLGTSIAEMARNARTIQGAECLLDSERAFNEADREDAYYDRDDPDSPASIDAEMRLEGVGEGYEEWLAEMAGSLATVRSVYPGTRFETWLATLDDKLVIPGHGTERELARRDREVIEEHELADRIPHPEAKRIRAMVRSGMNIHTAVRQVDIEARQKASQDCESVWAHW